MVYHAYSFIHSFIHSDNLYRTHSEALLLKVGGLDPPDFGQEGRRGPQGVVKYYYILSCTGSMFECVGF